MHYVSTRQISYTNKSITLTFKIMPIPISSNITSNYFNNIADDFFNYL